MKNTLILVVGGARSGKSRFALTLADAMDGRKVFLATAQSLDEEMSVRIEKHKMERPIGWDTLEEAERLTSAVKHCRGKYEIVLIDCLTLWIANLLTQVNLNESEIAEKVHTLIDTCKNIIGTVVIVSNEIGSGIVPDNTLSRLFRDVVGRANQEIASRADEMYLVVAGIPLHLKSKNA